MGKKKNKKQKIETVDSAQKIIDKPILLSETPFYRELDFKLKSAQEKLNINEAEKNNVKQYLDNTHNLYHQIKERALSIKSEILDEPAASSQGYEYGDNVFFDLENNNYLSKNLYLMPECYVDVDGSIRLCQDNGLYIDKKQYSSSRLFLADKTKIDSDLNYISSFEKILDAVVSKINSNNKFTYFCMLPESVDMFNTKLRRCLNTSKGKIISIPKSIAVTYCMLKELNFGDRFCVADLDGLHPVVTQLFIGKDENGEKVILREGFITKHTIKYDYLSFANDYLNSFSKKYDVTFTDDEKNNLVTNKKLMSIFLRKEIISLFRDEGRISVFFDEDIYNKCIKEFSTTNCIFSRCSKAYIVSSIPGLVSGENLVRVEPIDSFKGLEFIRNKLHDDENAIIWKERLPRVSLEVIDDNIGRFKVVDLIEEDNEGQNIRLSVDEEIELPFKGTITLQKGKKEYYLPLDREVYSEDINSAKEAYFCDKSFPLEEDLLVDLVVRYNYMSESPIKLYAIPRTRTLDFTELSNTWVDPHEIKVYSGPIYNGHPKKIEEFYRDDTFTRTTRNLSNFMNGYTRFNEDSWKKNKADDEFHLDYQYIIYNFRSMRSLFDSSNVKTPQFKKLFEQYQTKQFLDTYLELYTEDSSYKDKYSKKDVKKYLSGLQKPMSDMIVASWYYMPKDSTIKSIYSMLATNQKHFDILARLSRCILAKEDDIYNVFDNLSDNLYKEISKAKAKKKSLAEDWNDLASDIRDMSSNCWFNKNWIYNFYYSSKGKECIPGLISAIHDYLVEGVFGHGKKFRDIMEFLVCISRLKSVDPEILNPNRQETKEILYALKNSYNAVEAKVGTEKMVSRLSMSTDQGPLFGYKNYIYMLIMTLSGEGQVDLVGYHDD